MTKNDDVLINKAVSIEKCIKRIRESYGDGGDTFLTSIDSQDIAVLNLQRACQAAIDMGARSIQKHSKAIPQSASDIFEVLYSEGVIDLDLRDKMQSMVGFCNIAVHEYSRLNLQILIKIIENNLGDLQKFSKTILEKN